ncbi:MAG: hypothetical protein U1E65_09190 [Myxococcota bacterium]
MANNIPTGPAPSASAPTTTPARSPETETEKLKGMIKNFQFYTDLSNIPGPIGAFFKQFDQAAKDHRETIKKM